jgi:hypothetical protein
LVGEITFSSKYLNVGVILEFTNQKMTTQQAASRVFWRLSVLSQHVAALSRYWAESQTTAVDVDSVFIE